MITLLKRFFKRRLSHNKHLPVIKRPTHSTLQIRGYLLKTLEHGPKSAEN